MQTHAVRDAGQADTAHKRRGASRPPRGTTHDGHTLGPDLVDIPILPDGSGGSSAALHRRAAGPGPSSVPASVREVLRRPGRSLPAGLRGEMEARLGCDFSDVRLHTDEEAGRSAAAVAAEAYTIGRHIVFAPGRFDPGSTSGRRLLTHELVHAASLPRGAAVPTGGLRISAPAETAERRAVAVAEGVLGPPVMHTIAPPALYRAPAPPVALTGVTVNHDRVTVPPPAGHGLKAVIDPANATGVTFAITAGTATFAAGTKIDSTTGKITIDAKQTGGSADVEASQTIGTTTTTFPASFNFTGIPGTIKATTAATPGNPGEYGGEFTHTFDPPSGGKAAELELAHVNEKFKGASGTLLTITGKLGTFKITVNDPSSATDGWDLDATGKMAGPDHVTWDHGTDARSFVKNASNPAPTDTLPQEVTADQSMRNLTFPTLKYGAAAVATTTHRRAFEDRAGKLKAVTSANAPGLKVEVEEGYEGPTVFRNAKADPTSIAATTPPPPGGTPAAAATSTITVDAEGQATAPTFAINPPDLGCTIDPATGVLTAGPSKGTVTVQAGDGTNFDETKVTIA